MRLIDADALIKEIHDIFTPYEEEAVKRALQYASTIDAVEVVRCRQCRNYSFEGYCDYWFDYHYENDFCNYGKAK